MLLGVPSSPCLEEASPCSSRSLGELVRRIVGSLPLFSQGDEPGLIIGDALGSAEGEATFAALGDPVWQILEIRGFCLVVGNLFWLTGVVT
jgi:hypothetical protein